MAVTYKVYLYGTNKHMADIAVIYKVYLQTSKQL